MSIRTLLIWGVIALVLVVVFTMFRAPAQRDAPELAYSELLARVGARAVVSAETRADAVIITDTGGARYLVFVPEGAMADTVQRMHAAGVRIVAVPYREGPTIREVVLGLLPMLVLIAAWFFMMRKLRPEGGSDGP